MKLGDSNLRRFLHVPRLQRIEICVVLVAVMLASTCTASADDFLEAIRAGDLGQVKAFVQEQPELVKLELNGESPLYWAVSDHHVDLAKWLLDNGANVNQPGGQDLHTPIFDAQTAEMAELLIEHGANLRSTNKWSSTPLREAVRGNHVGVVKVLVDAGLKLDFDMAVELGETKLVAEMLAEKPWLAKPPRKPLYYAAQDGNVDLVELLLRHGADPDLDFGFANVSGAYTPLTNAVKGSHYEIAELLFKQGASPNVSGGRNHGNLFLYAIAYRDARFTKLMLDHGADLIDGDRWGLNVTPLHVAAALGGGRVIGRMGRVGQPASLDQENSQALEKVRLLLQAGAIVNARTSDGSTPLLFAAIAGNLEVCELLLKHDAKWDIGSACLLRKRDIVERLVKESPELLTTSDMPLKQPALHSAVRANDIEIVKLLLANGANANAKAPELVHQDAGGFSSRKIRYSELPTALHIATEQGYQQVAEILLGHGADINPKGVKEVAMKLPLGFQHAQVMESLQVIAWMRSRNFFATMAA